jgi:hypothetical protein
MTHAYYASQLSSPRRSIGQALLMLHKQEWCLDEPTRETTSAREPWGEPTTSSKDGACSVALDEGIYICIYIYIYVWPIHVVLGGVLGLQTWRGLWWYVGL